MIRDVSTSKEEIDLTLTIRQWLYGKDGTVHFANTVSRFELDEYGNLIHCEMKSDNGETYTIDWDILPVYE
jgi:hypothetical protein